MLMAYAFKSGFTEAPDLEALRLADWIDLESATEAETALVEQATGLRVPTLAALSEIENSSRLAVVGRALYLSMPWLVGVAGHAPRTSVLGFVLTEERVLSIRFGESLVMKNFAAHLRDRPHVQPVPMHVFVGITEAMVDRFADILEEAGAKLDAVSAAIFSSGLGEGRRPKREDALLRQMLREVGAAGDTISRLRDSLLALGRMVQFVVTAANDWLPGDAHARFRTVDADVRSLADHDSYLINKIQFLQDAILGFINIAQNNVIKVLTVVSVVGIPPTLVASIYGMNFKMMPELEWAWGYPYGLTLIAVSAVAPLIWFRLKGWI